MIRIVLFSDISIAGLFFLRTSKPLNVDLMKVDLVPELNVDIMKVDFARCKSCVKERISSEIR